MYHIGLVHYEHSGLSHPTTLPSVDLCSRPNVQRARLDCSQPLYFLTQAK